MIKIDVNEAPGFTKITTVLATDAKEDVAILADADGVQVRTDDDKEAILVYVSHQILAEMFNTGRRYYPDNYR